VAPATRTLTPSGARHDRLSDADTDALLPRATESLAAIDADPRFYTTSVAADDVDDVRAALGYEAINLYGTSYGGTLAQYYLRQHGDSVRVAVLDGATPVDVRVFERMAASSQAALDPTAAPRTACDEAFRSLPKIGCSGRPFGNPDHPRRSPVGRRGATTHRFRRRCPCGPATEATAGQIPLAIHLAYQEKWIEAAQIISGPASGGPTLLMTDEIFCSEAWARFDPSEAARLGAGSYALSKQIADAEERAEMCRLLPEGMAPSDDAAPVRTDKPVLWIVGDADPQDPPANLTGLPDQQPNSRVVVMPAQQHVVGHLGCMPSLIADFLEAGSPDEVDASCAADGPTPSLTFRLD
jgi:pimeloyl-ACP methyl ester carboxylesterase